MCSLLSVVSFGKLFLPPYEFKEIIRQCYEVGFRSLLLISTTGFITGMVFTNQSRPSLAEFGATSWLPSLIAIAIVRALGPLVTALIAAGKVGSSIGAEMGSMNVTEQIDAMEVSGTNPFKFLVVSRVLATSITIPILTMYTIFVALLGGFLNVSRPNRPALRPTYRKYSVPFRTSTFSRRHSNQSCLVSPLAWLAAIKAIIHQKARKGLAKQPTRP